MTVKKIVGGMIMVRDEIQINNWSSRFTVCAVSDGFILAHCGDEYTIIQRAPLDFGPYNDIPKGAFICGADYFTFGWKPDDISAETFGDRYQFENPQWCDAYMRDLESGRTKMSMQKREQIQRISIYRRGMCVAEGSE